MRIHVYSVSWNERHMLPFFLRHYAPFAARIVIYDEDSTDGTAELLRHAPNVELRRFVRTHPDSFEISKQHLFNRCWKESRGSADWVIIADIDEHVHHRDLPDYLARQQAAGVTLAPTLGFQMVSETFPAADEHLASTCTRGAPWWPYSKPVVFDPNAMQEINLSAGAHEAQPVGRLQMPPRDELMLLHYKLLGLEHTIERYRLLAGRVGPVDTEFGMDRHFHLPAANWNRHFATVQRMAVDVAAPAFDPATVHAVPPWRARPLPLQANGAVTISPGPIKRPTLWQRGAAKVKRWSARRRRERQAAPADLRAD
jgi:hypothetical protein